MYKIELFSVNKLKHIEDYSRDRVTWLKSKILEEKVWDTPICVTPDGLVMDGQHRMEVSKSLGLSKVPAIVFNYEDVKIYSLREDEVVSVPMVIEKAESKNIYPYKTVKHIFPIEIPKCNFKIEELK